MSDHIGTFRHIEERVIAWASTRPDVHGVLAVGSRARSDKPADEYSDLDLVIFADVPNQLIENDEWLEEIGTVVLSFIESTADGTWKERRTVFEPMLDVDFAVVPAELLQIDFSVPDPVSEIVQPVLDRGFRVVHDPSGRLAKLDEISVSPGTIWKLPDEAGFRNLTVDFWYHAIWMTKKLRRGEILVARQCLENYMKDKLIHVINWHAHLGRPDVDTRHGPRFFEKWSDADILESFHATDGSATMAHIARDLERTMDLFSNVSRSAAIRLHYTYPDNVEMRVRDWIHATGPDTLS